MTDAQAACWAALPTFTAATAAYVAARVNRPIKDVKQDLDALVASGQAKHAAQGMYLRAPLDRRKNPR